VGITIYFGDNRPAGSDICT